MARQVRQTDRRLSRATKGASRENNLEDDPEIPIEIMLKSKIVRETLKAKSYDLNQVETGDAQIDEDLMRLLEKLADDKPVIREKGKEEPEVTILRRNETGGGEDSLKEKSDGKEVVTKSLMTYLGKLGLGRRKGHLRRRLNTLD